MTKPRLSTGKTITTAVLRITLLTLVVSATACQDQRADKAYLRSDYQKSVTELESLAKMGEPRAEYDLGLLYDQGLGVPKNDAQAFHWYSRAAEHGHVKAQYNLGLMYMNGQGMTPDLVRAYYWLSLAVAGGEPKAPAAQDYLQDTMTPNQVTEAQQLVRERLGSASFLPEPKMHHEAP
ncbi:MAG TPA: tetratricopeptide repeat protein [Nitrospira sp.]|nr:tetratricopeptide repeat protein [Nitrospira sp.]